MGDFADYGSERADLTVPKGVIGFGAVIGASAKFGYWFKGYFAPAGHSAD